MIMFKVGQHDFSNHVIASKYKVHNVDVFSSWTDANYRKHCDKQREKVTGSFEMIFKTIEEYEEFAIAMRSNKTSSLSYNIVVADNINNEQKEIEAYVTWKPSRSMNDLLQDYFEKFTVTIEER